MGSFRGYVGYSQVSNAFFRSSAIMCSSDSDSLASSITSVSTLSGGAVPALGID